MKSFEKLNKTDVLFSSSEVENLEAAMRTLLKATSLIDWLAYGIVKINR